ncbi:MAG: GyrI-like domain-containing protein [Proteobacteria bacterium]|nr:GyrI-like domain-containing protein [Pseudomonadota bacterium]
MDKVDFKKTLKQLYSAPSGEFVAVDVPPMQFVMVDGEGDPNTAPAYRTAVEWLYGASYAMKFAAKLSLGRDYVVPPLEGLWSADDPRSFTSRDKDRWRWTMMILVPEFVTHTMFEEAVAKTGRKSGTPPETLRLEVYHEGPSLQILHIGSYDDEGPVLARLHTVVMPEEKMDFNGPHHEIYLGDPRKTVPSKLRTILRQPVKAIAPA